MLSGKLDRLEESLLGISPELWPHDWNAIWEDFKILYRRRRKLQQKLGRT